ncbi:MULTISPECIES: FAD synthetase family protein [Planococcus]|uniref:FAD synthase n=1 Tax=Planococcus liqunii TaxID=3058394 RepID=A0ABT8MSM5_9BACL|nr:MULTISPECIES: FAD synthetase family protein [Planococcus]MBX0314678.1 FAD synthetase family protein [Planococcus glaciei]MDN7227907.1 FAD synthetase family protein [Planococcus sp. N064]
MQTIHLTSQNTAQWHKGFPEQAVAIGFFDGLHKGHLSVIQEAKRLADKAGIASAVMSFFPHPKTVLGKGAESFPYLMPLEEKQAALEALGIDTLFLVHFDRDIAGIPPAGFVEQFLIGLNAVQVVCGSDFHYGARGSGNTETLAAQGAGHFGVSVVELMEFGGEKISSTRIRQALAQGNISIVRKLLGKFYSVNWCPKNGLLPFYSLPAPGKYEVKLHHADETVSCKAQVLNDKEAKFTHDFKQWSQAVRIEWIRSIGNH